MINESIDDLIKTLKDPAEPIPPPSHPPPIGPIPQVVHGGESNPPHVRQGMPHLHLPHLP